MDILRVRLVGRQQLVTSGLGHEVCASFGPWFRQGKERCQRPPPTLHLQVVEDTGSGIRAPGRLGSWLRESRAS